jgi:hypothetical protein
MAKSDRILSFFPAIYGATDTGKLLREVVRLLAQPLEEADTHLFRIQRSHRLKVAENADDIIKLAGALNLTAFYFEDIVTDENLNYNQKLSLMRERVQRVARVHLKGLGTPWAVMESAAIFLNASIIPERPGDPEIKHLDDERFSHKAVVEFPHLREFLFSLESALQNDLDMNNTVSQELRREFRVRGISLSSYATVSVKEKASIWLMMDQDNQREYLMRKENDSLNVYRKPRDRIYLHENPFRRKKIEPAEKWTMNSWAVENQNFNASPIRFVIQGVGDHTIMPSIFCPDTQEGILFNGIVPHGQMLVIDETNGATLNKLAAYSTDNVPVDDWIVYFKGGLVGFSRCDNSDFVREQGGVSAPFDGDTERIISRPFREKKPVPTAPVGRSMWYFKVAEGVYDGSDFDFSVYAMNPEPIGVYDEDSSFDESVFDFPACGVVGMAWDERVPCSFKLAIPGVKFRERPPGDSTQQDEGAGSGINYVSRIGGILPRFKAAGIQAFVDAAKDAWVLGESVIRDADATDGEGVQFHTTLLRGQNADIIIPLDKKSS